MVDRFDGPPLMQPYKNGDFVRYSDYAELEAEVALLRRTNVELQQFINERANERDEWKARAKALSRTGAVKVKALEWEERKTRLGTVWWRAPNPLGGLSIEAASENDKIAAQADYERRILSALEPAAPEGRQEAVAWQHIPGCGTDRESKMVSVSEGAFCDPCIAPLVAALNTAGIETVASCCGHGHRPGVIALRDGRELFIAKDFNEARQIDAIFPIDINGNTRPSEQAVTEAMVEAAISIMFHKHGWFPPRQVVKDALKAAMEAGRHD